MLRDRSKNAGPPPLVSLRVNAFLRVKCDFKKTTILWNLLYKHSDVYGTLQVITELTHLILTAAPIRQSVFLSIYQVGKLRHRFVCQLPQDYEADRWKCQYSHTGKEIAAHSRILAWEIPWTEEPCRL